MRSYLESAIEKDGLERFSGVNITNPGYPHQVHRPAGEKGRTVFRIYPYCENGEEKPLRLTPEDFKRWSSSQSTGVTCNNAFYPWMTAEKMVTQMGLNNKFTVLTTVRDKGNRFKSPIELFVGTMSSAIKNNPKAFPDWSDWLETGKGVRAVVPRIETVGFIQCILFENAGKAVKNAAGQPAPLHPVIFILPKTARENLEELCNQQNEVGDYAEDDFAARFKYNDLVSSANGKALTLTYHPQHGLSLSHYTLEIGQTYPLDPRLVTGEFKPWEELLHYCTEEEQMTLLSQAYPPEAMDFVFESSPWSEFLSENMRGKFNQSRSQTVVSRPQQQTTSTQPVVQPTVTSSLPSVGGLLLPPKVPGADASLPQIDGLMPPPIVKSNLPSIGVAPLAPLPVITPSIPPVSDVISPVQPIGDPVVDQAGKIGIREKLRIAQEKAHAQLSK